MTVGPKSNKGRSVYNLAGPVSSLDSYTSANAVFESLYWYKYEEVRNGEGQTVPVAVLDPARTPTCKMYMFLGSFVDFKMHHPMCFGRARRRSRRPRRTDSHVAVFGSMN